MLDVAVRGGVVVTADGSLQADVGILRDRIEVVGDLSAAAAGLTIDATDRYVLPGLIDAHSHLDLAVIAEGVHPATLHQGVTTVVLGQDGTSVAPGTAGTVADMRRYFAAVNGRHEDIATTWTTVGEYLDRVDGASTLNVAYLVPNGNLRLDTVGWARRPAKQHELQMMNDALRAALDDGAIGLSSGLDYAPSMYADTQELAALCDVVRERDRVYVTHMRGYDDHSPEGFAEVAEIGHATGVRIHISHLMGKTQRHIPVVDQLVRDGVDLSFDSYPYLAGCSILTMLALPPSMQAGGPDRTLDRLADPELLASLRGDWFIRRRDVIGGLRLASIAAPGFQHLEGASLDEACGVTGMDAADLVCTLLIESGLEVAVLEPNGLDEQDLRDTLRHPLHSAGSDGVYASGKPHPRGWGAFARYMGRYTRELGDLTWSDAVRHLSTAAADRLGLTDRGRIAPGKFADLVVLDPSTVSDTATYQDPTSLAVGVDHVFVNGVPALINGRVTGRRGGRAIRA
jgi:N-acyl-D-amino-acid deacylase